MENSDPNSTPNESQEMAAIMERPRSERLKAYAAKCGPGWLQGAITLGGGSLAGSLYLGIISGYGLIWLQPLAMVMGVIMLSAISYVTLSTGERPFASIKSHVSPVLAWGWLIATLLANIVWCLPQFALGTAAITQNLVPSLGEWEGNSAKYLVSVLLFTVATVIIWFYDTGSKGVKLFETILKVMVAVVVISFFGVVVAMAGQLPWGEIFSGLIPDFSLLNRPATIYNEAINQTGQWAELWQSKVVGEQKDKMITAFATAVGINMTFLLPYSMLKKGWGKNHRGLAIFDLSTGLIIPYVLATGCVVLAAASQFHGRTNDVLVDGQVVPKMVESYNKVADWRLEREFNDFKVLDEPTKQARRDALAPADKQMVAMLANRDAFNLADALRPLTKSNLSQYIFGIGVFGMALSTIIILMLISGFTFCEMLGAPHSGKIHRLGSLVPGVLGIFFPVIWSTGAQTALAVPTSVIGGALLPIAYVTFFLLMNCRPLLGDAMPRGRTRLIWNVLMGLATSVALFSSIWGLWNKKLFDFAIGKTAVYLLITLLVLGIGTFLSKSSKRKLL